MPLKNEKVWRESWGRKPGHKMLFPMILMLGAVMLILAFPAMRSMEL